MVHITFRGKNSAANHPSIQFLTPFAWFMLFISLFRVFSGFLALVCRFISTNGGCVRMHFIVVIIAETLWMWILFISMVLTSMPAPPYIHTHSLFMHEAEAFCLVLFAWNVLFCALLWLTTFGKYKLNIKCFVHISVCMWKCQLIDFYLFSAFGLYICNHTFLRNTLHRFHLFYSLNSFLIFIITTTPLPNATNVWVFVLVWTWTHCMGFV